MSTKKKNYYFTQETENAILAYNIEDDPVKRNKLYNDSINYALDKLTENLIHTYKFYQINAPYEDVKHMVSSFLVSKLSRYKKEKGKAYSYFTIVGRNFLIAENTKAYKAKLDFDDVNNLTESVHGKFRYDLEERNIFNEDSLQTFFKLYIEHIYKNMEEYFTDLNDKRVADAILAFFENYEDIELYNKKALYFIVRERTAIETPKISKVVKILKQIFYNAYKEYREEGEMSKVNYLY